MQVRADGTVQDQGDPDFCAPATPPAPGTSLGQGSCPGQDQAAGGGSNFSGGRWYFTIDGQPFPSVPIKAPGGEIWRITNASGSVGYDLDLWNPGQQRQMVMQVLAVDGVAVSPPPGTQPQQLAEIGGDKIYPGAPPRPLFPKPFPSPLD